MAEESGQERTETATAKRRDDFRQKGQVAQSKEVTTAGLFTLSLVMWLFYLRPFWESLQDVYILSLTRLRDFQVTPGEVVALAWAVGITLAKLLWPIFLVSLVVGLVSSFLQVGPLLSTKVFKPDISKFDPIKGMKKFVSKRSAMELVKSLAKVSLITYVAYLTVANEFEAAMGLGMLELNETLIFLSKLSLLVMGKTCAIMIVLAFIDFSFTRYEMEQKMKMTKQEVKEEHKDTEGNPQIKSRIRSLQMQQARRRMMAEVPKADVIITNPTHLSIAISYERENMDAPQIVAKGADHLAFKIREIAREHDISVIENKPLARALYKQEIGEQIPEELFTSIAEVLAYVYRLKSKK
ncbi:MAG: flagellar biosynthesis protein FlhB [Pelovirga sp.]